MMLTPIPARRIRGPLGEAVNNNVEQRIKRFVSGPESEPIRMFSPDVKEKSDTGDWYGEHAGKWLVAASRAWKRTDDAELGDSLEAVANALLEYQEPNGYLGTYAQHATCRFTSVHAHEGRTWDVWTHACMMLGLVEYWKASGREDALYSATRIADLLRNEVDPRRLLKLGNHHGLSSLIILEPFAKIAKATCQDSYIQYALDALSSATEAGLHVLTKHQADCDVSTIGSGKIYQLLWCALGLLELAEVSHDSALIDSAMAIVNDVEMHHLTPQGGPWGGIGTHKEVFNARQFFDPCGMVETCSSATWLALMRKLYESTREEKYLEMAQRTLWNAILGAVGPDGDSWIYFSFPNGRRNYTYHWACCKSSGMMALEEATLLCAHHDEDNLFVHCTAPFSCSHGSSVFELMGSPEEGQFQVHTSGIKTSAWMQHPSWISDPVGAERWCIDEGMWSTTFDVEVKLDQLTYTIDHHGQEIVREDYVTASYGPYSLATDLLDGFRKHETFRLPQLFPDTAFVKPKDGGSFAELRQPGKSPVLLKPYYLAGQGEGGWRASWLEVAWQ